MYLYIPCWTLNTDFMTIGLQDTTVGALVVMLHEQFMGWVPSNISYVYAWYVHAYLGIYQDMHVYTCISWYVPRYACMYMHILVCTCHINVCTVLASHVQVVRIPDDSTQSRRNFQSLCQQFLEGKWSRLYHAACTLHALTLSPMFLLP